MLSFAFSVLFVIFFMLTLVLRYWLASRHIRHVARHREQVPPEFAGRIPLEAHRKAADYTIAKTRFGLVHAIYSGLVLIGFTLLGGLQALSTALLHLTGPGMTHQIALVVAYAAIAGVLDLPFTYWFQFVLEQRFGFNKMTLKLWLADTLKGTLLGAVIGLPLLWVVLILMERSGALWWLYAWLAFSAFQLLLMVIYPTLIAPLFNKFTPLADDSLKNRIEGLMARVGFASKGLFVMDGSKRSSHGNAYFSGFGANKRIVFFDTLLERLAPPEIEAVLAHELGHFKLKHIVKRIVVAFALSLVFLALLGWLKNQVWFYTGLGVLPLLGQNNDAMALLLFMLVLPVFTFPFAPLTSITSRKHEFEADAFAAAHSDARDLVSALVKMYEDNASTLTPDPLHSAFYDSHPPASIRISRLHEAGTLAGAGMEPA
ncbi:peptidase M48 [Massilia sp. WF1]|uniref:M48 family metallopeptidase n=1 Tax=unclassified Massilia TaxID=2609279 RepID=UPI00064A7EA2|nr:MULTISPECIES: M48 family metallopeptidase [unclassified Massilia]ALK96428.1 peptidase M48 [Massilia sp. WG5]KLU37818.1 peptidase M48 [Massilia sp. WF1]